MPSASRRQRKTDPTFTDMTGCSSSLLAYPTTQFVANRPDERSVAPVEGGIPPPRTQILTGASPKTVIRITVPRGDAGALRPSVQMLERLWAESVHLDHLVARGPRLVQQVVFGARDHAGL